MAFGEQRCGGLMLQLIPGLFVASCWLICVYEMGELMLVLDLYQLPGYGFVICLKAEEIYTGG